MLPIALDLRGESVLIVGGNREAALRATSLCAEGARVSVIAPTAVPELSALAARRVVHWYVRPFSLEDARGCRLVFVADGDESVAQALHAARRRLGYWLCVVDRTDLTDALGMATLRAGPVRVAVSSSATAPGLSRHVRQELERLFDGRFAHFAERVAAYRSGLAPENRREGMRRALAGLRIDGNMQYPLWEGDETAVPDA